MSANSEYLTKVPGCRRTSLCLGLCYWWCCYHSYSMNLSQFSELRWQHIRVSKIFRKAIFPTALRNGHSWHWLNPSVPCHSPIPDCGSDLASLWPSGIAHFLWHSAPSKLYNRCLLRARGHSQLWRLSEIPSQYLEGNKWSCSANVLPQARCQIWRLWSSMKESLLHSKTDSRPTKRQQFIALLHSLLVTFN